MIALSPPGAIQRHLDRLHGGVAGSLGDELLDTRGEALVGVVHHDGAVAHHVEDRPIGFGGGSDASGGDRRPRLVLEVRPFELEQLPEETQVEWRSVERDVVHREVELTHEQFEHLGADVVRDLEAHRLVEATPTKLHLDRFEEVFGLLFFEGEVGVAADPERRPVLDDHADEQAVELRRDQLLDRQVAAGRDRHETWEQLGYLEAGETAVTGFGIGHVDSQRQREVGDVRERVPGVDCQRGEHREDPFVEPVVEFDAFVVGDAVPRDDADAGGGELGDELVDEGAIDAIDEVEHPVADLGEGLRRRATVGRRPVDTGDELILQGSNADLEELVEIRRRDGTELRSLQQWDPGLGGELQHALVELQPAELSIGEPFVGHRRPFTPPSCVVSV